MKTLTIVHFKYLTEELLFNWSKWMCLWQF